MEIKSRVAVAVTVMVFSIVLADATNYVVGDGFGWSITTNIQVWPRGKQFYAGDTLEFKYDEQVSDVRVVKKGEFEKCTVSEADPTYESGDDKIALNFGANYFSTSNADDCQAGLKLAINATSRPPLNRFILP